MGLWNNATGKPLADSDWLQAHHLAKLPERTAFVRKLAELQPTSVLDLGCATGLWLELCNESFSEECTFIGVDSDEYALEIAEEKCADWNRPVRFIQADIEKDRDALPTADLILAFNVCPYISDLDAFFHGILEKSPNGKLAVRQYDGASIRFGPMNTADRQAMESSLRIAAESSQQFNHYDLDRCSNTLRNLKGKSSDLSFELFARFDPFPQEFIPYYQQTIEWTRSLLPKLEADKLQQWALSSEKDGNRYFFEVDLVAILS